MAQKMCIAEITRTRGKGLAMPGRENGKEAYKDVEPLLSAFAKHVELPNCIPKVSGQTVKTVALAHKVFAQDLIVLMPTLWISKLAITAALLQVARDKREAWSVLLKDAEISDWSQEMGSRVHQICTFVSKELRRVPMAKWAADAFIPAATVTGASSVDAQPPAPSVDAGSETALEEQIEFVYGWDPEQQQAWRTTLAKPTDKEYALGLELPSEGAEDVEPMNAKFADETTAPIPDVTVGDYKNLVWFRKQPRRTDGTNWETTDKKGVRVWVLKETKKKNSMAASKGFRILPLGQS